MISDDGVDLFLFLFSFSFSELCIPKKRQQLNRESIRACVRVEKQGKRPSSGYHRPKRETCSAALDIVFSLLPLLSSGTKCDIHFQRAIAPEGANCDWNTAFVFILVVQSTELMLARAVNCTYFPSPWADLLTHVASSWAGTRKLASPFPF